MTRVRVWYDGGCDQIFISGEMHSFAPCSLACILNGNGNTILIHSKASSDTYVAGGNFADFGDDQGNPFSTPAETKAYLDDVFSRHSATGLLPINFIAGEPLSGQRVVRVAGSGAVRVASSDDVAHAGLTLGVTMHAADENASVAVTVVGEINEPTWAYTPGPVFLGLNGALIQAPPASGFVQQIGTAVTATRLVVERGAPIILAQ